MAITQNTYTGNGSTVLYSFAFPYLETTDVKVSLNGVVTTAYTFANATTIQFNTAPGVGVAIRIYRETDDTALQAVFSPGSSIRASDLNDNFDQLIYLGQEANTEADSATITANTALTNSNTAISTANTASTNASNAVTTANTASANASAAVTTANTASTNASNAVSTANTASTNASAAVTTANTALSTANSATTTANNATTTANTALSAANSAVSTANTASTNASAAVSTANTANSNATTALTTANNAVTTANTALSTANTANTKADTAIAAVSSSINYTLIANVAAIPASPANNTYIEVADSTGVESFTPLTGLPGGYVGDSGLTIRLKYTTTGPTWQYLNYFPNNSETRYLKLTGGTLTGSLTVPQGTTASPGIKFAGTGNENTGVYSSGIDELGLVTNGSNRLSIDSAGAVSIPGTLGVTGAITGSLTGAASSNVLKAGDTMTGALVHPLGAAATPSITFTGDTNTGVYSPGADQLALATNGTQRLLIDANGNLLAGTGALGFTGKQLTLKSGQGYIGLAVSGTESTIFSSWDSAATPLLFTTGTIERMRLDSSGRLGIGTSSIGSGASLQVGANGANIAIGGDLSANGSGRFKFITSNTVKNWQISNNDNVSGAFEITPSTAAGGTTFSTPAFLINSSGNVGIGTTNPATALQVGGSSGSTASPTAITLDSTFANSDAFDKLKLYLYKDATQSYGLGLGAGADVQYWAGSSSTGVHRFFTSQTERARIDSSGRLLVGTSTNRGNGSLLQVVDDASNNPAQFFCSPNNAEGPNVAWLKARGGSTGSPSIVSSGDTLGRMRFYGYDGSAYTEAASIVTLVDATPGTNDMPGRLVFSTTADGASSPTERMRINNSGQPLFGCTSSTTVGSHTGASNVSTFNFSGITLTQYSVSAGFYYDRLNFTNAQYFVVNSSGTGVYLGNGATSWTAYSDERLKTNIVELDGAAAWEHCKAARAVTFNWKSDKYPNGQRIGFVAQDWETLYPEVITTTDENIDGVETPKGMQYTETIPVLMAALKEAIAKIETLEAEVAALKGA